ncbi:MAG: cytochrome c biogenesis CcdA family protein [Hyphomicrobiales bacterium]
MTTLQQAFGSRVSTRTLLYAVFAALVIVPLLAFGLGPLTSDSFDLDGPGGPLLAFSAGVLSFVSPCVLPIVPIYISHLSGASIENGRVTTDRRVTFTHAVAFVGGLSVVFIVLGAGVGLLGSYFFKDNQRDMEEIAGLLLMGMGLVMVPVYGRASPMRAGILLIALTGCYFFIADIADLRGTATRDPDRSGLLLLGVVLLLAWLRFSGYLQIPFLARTFEVNLGRNREAGYTRSALIGGAFALGWTPCVGPVLGSILTLGATTSASTADAFTATYLLVAYAAGFSIPFLITGLAMSDVTPVFRRIQRYSPVIETVSAVVLIGLGLLLWYGQVSGLNELFSFADFNQGL